MVSYASYNVLFADNLKECSSYLCKILPYQCIALTRDSSFSNLKNKNIFINLSLDKQYNIQK